MVNFTLHGDPFNSISYFEPGMSFSAMYLKKISGPPWSVIVQCSIFYNNHTANTVWYPIQIKIYDMNYDQQLLFAAVGEAVRHKKMS